VPDAVITVIPGDWTPVTQVVFTVHFQVSIGLSDYGLIICIQHWWNWCGMFGILTPTLSATKQVLTGIQVTSAFRRKWGSYFCISRDIRLWSCFRDTLWARTTMRIAKTVRLRLKVPWFVVQVVILNRQCMNYAPPCFRSQLFLYKFD